MVHACGKGLLVCILQGQEGGDLQGHRVLRGVSAHISDVHHRDLPVMSVCLEKDEYGFLTAWKLLIREQARRQSRDPEIFSSMLELLPSPLMCSCF